MRVLHVHSGNMYGGVETLLGTMARLRAACPDLVPNFALCFEGRAAAELRESGAPVHLLEEIRLRSPLSLLRGRRALRRLIARVRPELVIVHSPWAQAVFGGTIRAAGLPMVLWVHDVPGRGHWLERLAARNRPDFAVCNSRFTREALAGVDPGIPAEVVYCPVEIPVRAEAPEALRREVRAALGCAPDATVVVQVSRMERWKGHELHLAALARLRDLPGWECWLVGGAQRAEEVAYVEELRALAERGGIAGRVRFLGHRDDVRRLLAAADIHCQPNQGPEPFGIGFVEAFGAGLPVVTTAMGGAMEVVDGSSGILVPPADPAALAEALRGLMEDPERRAALGAGGVARAARLTDPPTQLGRLLDILLRVSGSVHR